MKKHFGFLLSLCLLFPAASSADPEAQSDIPYKVALDVAHRLVRMGTGLGYKDGFVDQQNTPDKYGFFVMHGHSPHGEIIDLKGKHTPVFQWYAVNAWTGDVWNASGCQRLSNPSLHIPLAHIKAQFNENEITDYDKLRLVEPEQIVSEVDSPKRCGTSGLEDYGTLGAATHESVPYKVSSDLAYKLTTMAIRLNRHKSWMYSWELPDENGFYVIDVHGVNHDGVEGRYAVNAWTGDVWDMFSCKHFSTPGLRKERARIKRQFSDVEIKDYEHLHALHATHVGLELCGQE